MPREKIDLVKMKGELRFSLYSKMPKTVDELEQCKCDYPGYHDVIIPTGRPYWVYRDESSVNNREIEFGSCEYPDKKMSTRAVAFSIIFEGSGEILAFAIINPPFMIYREVSPIFKVGECQVFFYKAEIEELAKQLSVIKGNNHLKLK